MGRPCIGSKWVFVVCAFCGDVFQRRGYQMRWLLKRGYQVACSECAVKRAFCYRGHEMAGHNLRIRANGARQCRACTALRAREQYWRAKGRIRIPWDAKAR